jgi:uncharacterized membrane protein
MKKNIILIILSTLYLFCITSCKVNTEPTQSPEGYISVTVNDDIVGPVENVKIYIVPDSILQVTNEDGNTLFKVEVGDYFVDADVCCIGPGYIKYHEPVSVVENDTVKIELKACLLCL